MPLAHWHLVRSGQLQVVGSEQLATGEPFSFLPVFRTHREAEFYCHQSGLWHQGIRPRHNRLSFQSSNDKDANLNAIVKQAVALGVNAIGLFIGFNTHHESCWDYFRASQTLESLPENERPT